MAVTDAKPYSEVCVDEEEGGGADDVIKASKADSSDFPVWEAMNEWEGKGWAYSKLVKDTAMAQQDSLLSAFKDSVELSHMGLLDTLYRAVSMGSWQEARNIIGALGVMSDVELARKAVFTIQTDWEDRSGRDTTALRLLAGQCPDLGGKGVRQARMLLLALTGEDLDSADCDPGAKRAGTRPPEDGQVGSVKTWKVQCWPLGKAETGNPGQDVVYFRWDGPCGGKLRLHASSGAVIGEYALDANAEVSVPVSGLADGIYHWLFESACASGAQTGKFGVVH